MAVKKDHAAQDPIDAKDMNDVVTTIAGFGVHAQETPDLTVNVQPGVVDIKGTLVKFDGGSSPSFTAPSTNPRIDLLTIDDTGTLIRIAGVENVSPVAPDYPTDEFVLAEIRNEVGQTLIDNVDDASNGFILRTVRSVSIVKNFFGGDGSDGSLIASSGTTNLDFSGARFLIKNYTELSLTGSAKITVSNPNANGSILIIRVQGNVTLTASAPIIDVSDMGGAGGSGASGGGDGGNGGGGLYIEVGGAYNFTTASGIDVSGENGGSQSGGAPTIIGNAGASGLGTPPIVATGGTGGNDVGGTNQGGSKADPDPDPFGSLFEKIIRIAVGGGGGEGSGSAGGGGGGGGYALVVYNILTASSGTIATGGGSGTGGSTGKGGSGGGGASGNGGTASSNAGAGGGGGKSLTIKNSEFA